MGGVCKVSPGVKEVSKFLVTLLKKILLRNLGIEAIKIIEDLKKKTEVWYKIISLKHRLNYEVLSEYRSVKFHRGRGRER